MLDGWHEGELVGSGTVIWRSRRKLAAGDISEEEFLQRATDSAPSAGHCNTMGTASTMNAIAETLGLSLPGCAAIPAPYRERGQMAYETGRRAVEIAYDDLRPSKILTREAFLNAIRATTVLGGSSNAQPHIVAMARHAGIEIAHEDWMTYGYDLPLLVNMQPAGAYLGERFHRAGGVPAVLWELLQAGVLDGDCLTVTGKTLGENVEGRESTDRDVILPFAAPLKERAGFLLLRGNLFDFAIMKTSVISEEFRQRYLSNPKDPDAFEGLAVVFDGPEDYHSRIDDPKLKIDECTLLFMRGTGAIGFPGAAEVVNMRPPAYLIKQGVHSMPCIGDGRQSGTSGSPSILNASPEAAVGGGLALLRTGDKVRIDLRKGTANVLIADEELAERRKAFEAAGGYKYPASQTPWQEIQRSMIEQLNEGMTLKPAVKYQKIVQTFGTPRDNH
jgi:dihydroxy-acid dehydratase